MYLRSFEYFRAIAIVLIVAGHCFGISGWQIDSFAERMVGNIISGGSSLFVFVSGFLFHHVFYPTFNYRIFMKKKVQNVLLPYLFLSIFAIAQALAIHGPFPETYFGPQQGLIYQLVRPVLLYLLTGALLLAAVQALLYASCGDLQKPPFRLQGIDINLLQKLLLCLFFMVFLHRHEALDSKLLKSLASSSFAIYFLHGWVIYFVSLIQWLYSATYGVHLLPLLSAAVVCASYFLSLQIKAMFPRYSRMLIGW
jgi:surface polysaccharide O-acyltransferase-like enzyme